MARVKHLCCLAILLTFHFCALASHIVGGEVSYRWLDGDRYEIQVDIYQDCIPGEGDPDAIRQDNPAFVAIFDGAGKRLIADSITAASSLSVPANFSNACINNPPVLCLNKVSFVRTYTLPANASGYYIVYQRCCRNASIANIFNAGNTGATYYALVPPRAAGTRGNSSAAFRNYPPQIICINNPLYYDHSATDADGDSLSYAFGPSYIGGSGSVSKPMPQSTSFQQVTYNRPYTPAQPMSASPALQINPATGLITGTPDAIGRYVVAVSCLEWREGILINTVTREFQFVVTACSKAVVADIPQFSSQFNTYLVQCRGKTVKFRNRSTGANSSGGNAYSWDFGVAGRDDDTSHAFEPEYTYPDTGVYTVKLIINRGTSCADSISRLVKIYPEFHADFTPEGSFCPGMPVHFINMTTSTFQPVVHNGWDFGDGSMSEEESPVHRYETGGDYVVQLRGENVKGCVDTAIKNVQIERFRPFAGNDTIIVKGEHIRFHAVGGQIYTWSPPVYLDNPHGPSPTGFYPDTARLDYVVHIATESGCEGDDTINVWVVGQSAIFVPSAFSPNGDGRNDVLRPIGIGYGRVNYFRVFNRWGQGVFYGTQFNEGWDGSYQGHPADIGTYFWELSVRDRTGEELKLKGDATLIR